MNVSGLEYFPCLPTLGTSGMYALGCLRKVIKILGCVENIAMSGWRT